MILLNGLAFTADTVIVVMATVGIAFLGGLAGWILSIQGRTAKLEASIEGIRDALKELTKEGGPLEQGEKGYLIASRVGKEVQEVRGRVQAIEANCAMRARENGAIVERLSNFGDLLQEVRDDVKDLIKWSGGGDEKRT